MTCKKNAYQSRAFAERVAKHRMRDDRTLELRIYLCPACGHWHITHEALRKSKRRRAENFED